MCERAGSRRNARETAEDSIKRIWTLLHPLRKHLGEFDAFPQFLDYPLPKPDRRSRLITILLIRQPPCFELGCWECLNQQAWLMAF